MAPFGLVEESHMQGVLGFVGAGYRFVLNMRVCRNSPEF